jgi:hypothetical protein
MMRCLARTTPKASPAAVTMLWRDSKAARSPNRCATSVSAAVLRATDTSSWQCAVRLALSFEQPVDRDRTRSSDCQPQKQCQILSLIKPQQSFE